MSYPLLHKRNWSLKFALLLTFSMNSFLQSDAQFLKASGTKITNGTDTDFIIRSVGLGGYMLQEPYMLHLPAFHSQTMIREKIRQMAGDKATEAFYKDWRKNFIQKSDIDSMAAWGFNALRLPMHYNLFTLPVEKEPVQGQQTWLPEGFSLVDSLLSWCKQAKVYLILDLHAAPGGQGNDLPISDRDPALPSLWQSKANQDKTVALWEKLADRYKDEPYIGGYDLLNETNWGFEDSTDIRGTKEKHNQPLWALLKRITAAVRKYDRQHMIILEGNGFANNYSGLDTLWDDNIVLSFHKYGNFNDKNSIQYFLDLRTRLQAPVWLGESGENSNNWFMHCIRLMEHNQIGWSWWPWKKMGINNPLEIKVPKNYGQFIRYAAGKGPKPDPVKARQLLSDLLRNIQIQHNIIHRDVTDAMFRSIEDPSARPFRPYTVSDRPCYILAADYDLGANGYAYLDKDTARYQYTPGVHTEGNKGHSYRNDGVDVKIDSVSGKPYVFSVQQGEWLSYSLTIERSGAYNVQLDFAKDAATGSGSTVSIELFQGDRHLGHLAVDPTPLSPANFIRSKPVQVQLSQGRQAGPVKILFNSGGVAFRGFIISPGSD